MLMWHLVLHGQAISTNTKLCSHGLLISQTDLYKPYVTDSVSSSRSREGNNEAGYTYIQTPTNMLVVMMIDHR